MVLCAMLRDTKRIIADNIVLYRKAAGLSQQELGLLLGFKEDTAQTRISTYEKKRRSPNKRTLDRLAKILKRPIIDFYIDLHDNSDSLELEKEIVLFKEEAAKYGGAPIVHAVRMSLPSLYQGTVLMNEEGQQSRTISEGRQKQKKKPSKAA